MRLKLTKKQIVSFLIIWGLLLVLPLTLFLVRQRQEVRKEAAGSSEVALRLAPSGGEKKQGENFIAKIKLFKIAQREIKISGAEAVLEVDKRLNVSSVSCSSNFDGLKIEKVEGKKITLMCTINVDTKPVSLASGPVSLGTINFSVGAEAQTGAANVSFAGTRVTEAGIAGQAPDVSTAGEKAVYTIVPSSSLTPSPTNTPSPSAPPSLTSTPSPTETPLPTITPLPNCQKQKKKGDYDCSGQVDEKDFSNPDEGTGWLEKFLEGKATLPFFEYWRRSFFK